MRTLTRRERYQLIINFTSKLLVNFTSIEDVRLENDEYTVFFLNKMGNQESLTITVLNRKGHFLPGLDSKLKLLTQGLISQLGIPFVPGTEEMKERYSLQ